MLYEVQYGLIAKNIHSGLHKIIKILEYDIHVSYSIHMAVIQLLFIVRNYVQSKESSVDFEII